MVQTMQAATCSHGKREHLGTEEGAEFYRCVTCGAVVVVQYGKAWQVRPVSGVRA